MKRIVLTVLRSVAAAAALVLLFLFIFPVSVHILNIGNITGALLCVWVLLVCCAPVHRRLRAWCNRRTPTRIARKAVNILCAALLIYGAAATTAIAIGAYLPPEEDATLVVLGAEVKKSGKPSLILRTRIRVAEDYLRAHPEAKAVLSGGKGDDEAMSEAECMYTVMVSDGIEPERLYKEDRSTNTRENFAFSEKIIRENGLSPNFAVATDGFHQLRARIIAAQLGLSGSIGTVTAHTKIWFLPTYVVREWFALPYQLTVW